MSFKHLRERKYYEDLYDRHTVEESLWKEDYYLNKAKSKEGERLPEHMAKWLCRVTNYFYTGERYRNRQSSISEWMERDRILDDICESTPIPNVKCFMCETPMEFVHKNLKYDLNKPREAYVDFVFRCEECEVISWVNEKTRRNEIPWQCPDCKRRMDRKTTRVKDKITTVESCEFCGYKNKDVLDLGKSLFENRKPSKAEVKKFREDKLRFCLNGKDGQEFIDPARNLDSLSRMMEEVESKKDLPKVKVLSVKEVQDLLKKCLSKNGCENISFSLPDSARDVVLNFKAIDSKSREPYYARRDLKKSISALLNGTNWKLMSTGIESRLGVITGGLRGREISANFDEDVIL